ncbi:MAG: hypothetical protein B7Y99_02855 [Caulobacterales bacterium 32-69-10]|nr:MAG: hypothetical protein B7Y99_02855 [Caulobacterales bacterium 32-69-10]
MQQMAVLSRLTEIGMEIAEAAGRAARLAETGAPGADAPDPGLTFARAARAVRLTIALQSRLAKDLTALGEAEARARAKEAARRRDRIHLRIERVAETERPEEDEAERLSSDAWERLTEMDDADILDLPMDEMVARICADLGLSPDWAASAFPLQDHPAEEGPALPGLAPVPPRGDLPRPPASARAPPPDLAADGGISCLQNLA